MYANTISNDYNLDDEFVTNKNPQIAKGITAIPEIITSFYQERQGFTYGYRPLVKLSYAIEYSLFGWNPHASHAINALLYSLLIIIVFAVSKLLFKKQKVIFSALCTILFLVHPSHTEVVASLKNRDELLAALFGFAALYFFLRSATKHRKRNLILGASMLLLALLSKLSSLPFVALIPLSLFFVDDRLVLSQSSAIYGQKKWFSINFLISIFLIFAYVFLMGWVVAKNDLLGTWILKALMFFSTLLLLPGYFRNVRKAGLNGQRSAYGLVIILTIISAIMCILMNHFSIHFWINLLILLIIYIVNVNGWFVDDKILWSRIKSAPLYFKILGLLLIIVGVFALLAQMAPAAGNGQTEEYSLLYFQNPLYFQHSWFDRILFLGASLWFYFKLMIFPFNLGFYYGYNMIPAKVSDIFIWLALLIHIFLFFVSARAILKSRNIAAFGFVFYCIAISMYLNIAAPVAGIVAERLSFIASYGFCVALIWLVFKVSRQLEETRKGKSKNQLLLWILIAAIVLPFSVKTVSRNSDWANHTSLFAADIDHLQQSVKANDLMAAALYRDLMRDINKGKQGPQIQQRANEVLTYYGRCVKIYPEQAKVWNNMGLIRANLLQDFSGAANDFNAAVKYSPKDPSIWSSLGFCYFRAGEVSSAISAYQRALQLAPDSVRIMSSLANVYFQSGKTERAKQLNVSIAEKQPLSVMPWLNLASYALNQKDTISAISNFNEVLKRDVNNQMANSFLYQYYLGRKEIIQASYYQKHLSGNRP